MITNFMLNSKLILGAFALALTATTAFAQDAEVITKPAAKKKAVYAQQTFGYVEKSMFSTNTLKLEVLSTEPVVWNGKVIIINHGSTGRGHGTNGMDESRVKNTVKFLTLRKALVEKGYRVYDFGGAGKPNEEYGVREFKAKFGGNLVCYGRNTWVPNSVLLSICKFGYEILRQLPSTGNVKDRG